MAATAYLIWQSEVDRLWRWRQLDGDGAGEEGGPYPIVEDAQTAVVGRSRESSILFEPLPMPPID